jgi:CubicO group peptidase (beta-lactamase class C family)
MEDLYRFADDSLDERASGPGESFFYHNTGYTLLGQVIENISGESYASHVQNNILDPLDMGRSTFQEADVAADEDALTGYLLTDDGPEPSELPHDPLIYAAGGLLSSVSELANYLRMQLNDGEYNGEQILSKESLDQMREGYVG